MNLVKPVLACSLPIIVKGTTPAVAAAPRSIDPNGLAGRLARFGFSNEKNEEGSSGQLGGGRLPAAVKI